MLSEQKQLELEFSLNEDMGLGLAIPLGLVASTSFMLGLFLLQSISITSNAVIDKDLTERIRKIINDGTQFEVKVVKQPFANAFNMGTKELFITSKLKGDYKHNPRVIEGILLHEASHYYHKDVWQRFVISTSSMSPIWAAIFWGMTGQDVYAVAAMAVLLGMIVQVINGRRQERTADQFAAKYGYAKDLADYFKSAKKREDAVRNKVPKYFRLIYRGLEKLGELMDEHPTLDNRIKDLMQSRELAYIAKTTRNAKDAASKIGKIIFQK